MSVQASVKADFTKRSFLFRGKRKVLMERIGEMLLERARIDYETKSEGGTGTDGEKWKPNKPSTIARKARKRSDVKRLVAQREKIAARIRRTRGKRRKQRLVTQRAALLRQIERKEVQFAQVNRIGVDTGFQEASGIPGFDGGDGLGGNIFEIDSDGSITVGYGRSYSERFNSVRKLFPPDGKIQSDLMDEIEEEVTGWIIKSLRDI